MTTEHYSRCQLRSPAERFSGVRSSVLPRQSEFSGLDMPIDLRSFGLSLLLGFFLAAAAYEQCDGFERN